MCVSRRFLFVVSLAGEQDRCFSQTHLFLLLIHNLEPQAPVISLSFQKIIIVGGQYNGLFTGTFLDIKSTIWGLVPEKMGNYFYEFNVIMSKFGLILISLGSTFSHISWSWLIFLDYKVFCNIFHHRGKLEEKALFFFYYYFSCFFFGSFAYFSEPTREILQDFCTKRTAFCVFLRTSCQATEECNRGNLGQDSCCPNSFMSSQAIFVF